MTTNHSRSGSPRLQSWEDVTRLNPVIALAAFLALMVPLAAGQAATASSVNLSSMHCIITGSDTSIGTCIGYAFPIGFIGIMISFAIVGLAFMVGEALGMDSLKGWYRREMNETVKSTILLGSILFVLLVLSSIAVIATGGTASAAGSAGSGIASNLQGLYSSDMGSYLHPEMVATTKAFSDMLSFSMGLYLLKSLTFTVSIPYQIYFVEVVLGATFVPYSSNVLATTSALTYSFISDMLNLVVIPMSALFIMLYDLFPYMMEYALAVLLPLGLIMRSIPFMRNIGGTLIAIAIGTAIVYPTIILLFNLPVTNYFTETLQLPTFSASGSTQLGSFSSADSLFSILENNVNIGSSKLSQLSYDEPFWTGFIGSLDSIYPSINLITYELMNPLIQFFLNIFDIIIVLIITGNIAQMLGGSLTPGLGRLKIA